MTDWQTQLEQLKRDHRVPLTLAGCFALMLLWSLVQDISDFKETHRTITLVKTTRVTAPIHLETLHLMGAYNTTDALVPISTLQFALEGTIVFADSPSQSRAIISAHNAPAKIYKTGDTLTTGVTIKQIEKTYVVVDNNGTDEKIMLPINTLFPSGE